MRWVRADGRPALCMSAVALFILLLSACAPALVLDRDAVRRTAGCYRVEFSEWRINRDRVSVPKGVRTFELLLERVTSPRDSGSPEDFKVRQLTGPRFGDEASPGPFYWNVLRGPRGGFNMSNYNGLYGLYFHVEETDSGLVGPATIMSDYHVRGRDGIVSGEVATADVRAKRIRCAP